MAKDQDLGVRGDGVHPMNAHDRKDAADQTVKEAEGHGAGAWSASSCPVKPALVCRELGHPA